MTDLRDYIAARLREADIEGLLAIGAPPDEYDSEAQAIAIALVSMPAAERNEDSIAALVSAVWAEFFDQDEAALYLRLPVFRQLGAEIFCFLSV